MRTTHLMGVLALASGLPVGAGLQDRTATLSGAVTDADGKALAKAAVLVMGTDAETTTDEDGRYRLTGIPPGQHWILVRRDGYRPARKSGTLADGATRRVGFELSRLPAGGDEGTALADIGMNRARFQDFLQRSQSAFGTFLTEDELAASSDDLIDLARRYLPGRSRLALEKRSTDPGVRSPRLLRRTSGRASRSANRPYEGSGCAPAVSLNGSPPSLGASVADFEKEQVDALEVYRRGSWSPTEFAYRDGTGGCGLIVVWLK